MRWISRTAVAWALDEAPDVPARLVSTLVALASYAAEDGTGAYPSASTVALMTRKSASQAKRDIAALERLGLLQHGDRRLVKDIRADRRPKVYDLLIKRGASERTPSDDRQRGAHRRTPQHSRGASGYRTGRSSLQNGVHPDAPEEFLKNSGIASAPRARAEGARAALENPSVARLTWCAYCRSADHEHCTELRAGWTGPRCECPCQEGICLPCSQADHRACPGVSIWSECGTSPCECSGHLTPEAINAVYDAHLLACHRCAAIATAAGWTPPDAPDVVPLRGAS